MIFVGFLLIQMRIIRSSSPLGENKNNNNLQPKLTDEERGIAEYRKQLRDAEMERDILNKAISIFTKSYGRSTHS